MSSLKAMNGRVERLAAIARSARRLTADDQRFLTSLGRALGVDSIFADGGVNLLSAAAVNQLPNRQDALGRLTDSLAALVEAGQYRPATVQLGSMQVPVHNLQVASRLRAQYSADQFAGLLSLMRDNGVFKINVADGTGLVRTCDAEENANMSARQWVTDTIRCGDLERDVDPDGWRRALITLCHFYNQPDELAAMAHATRDPDWYRQGDVVNGVAHIFIPDTLKRDTSWFNNKRLESHGLALEAMCDFVAAQVCGTSPTPLQRSDLGLMLDTIGNLSGYLKSINTNPATGRYDFNAPSAGAWEEIPFPGGLTWDTEAMRAAFASLRALLSVAPDWVREWLIGSRFGAWLASDDQLHALVSAAHRKVMRRLFAGKQPMESPIRPSDSSLSFISTSGIRLGRTVADDVSRHFAVLDFLEQRLVRDHGIIRYAPFRLKRRDGTSVVACDSYLTRDYWVAPELRSALQGGGSARAFDSGDCSSEDDYVLRNAQASVDSEAEWFMVSVMAEGYSRQVSKLLDLADQRRLTASERRLLGLGQDKATQMINRSYARVTGKKRSGAPCLKSNGRPCAAFAVPEAYELVSALGSTGATALPGADTPLAWAASSLYAASRRFTINLARLQVMKR